jgi:hypothetical protein
MSDDRQTIEDYAQALERCLVGPVQDKARSREVTEHLYDAAEAGELAEALQRLGSPRSAAALFTPARTAPLASMYRRLQVPPVTSVVRRLSLLAGPSAWLDWLPQFWGDRRRLLDRLTRTKVVAQRGQREPRAVPDRPPAVL